MTYTDFSGAKQDSVAYIRESGTETYTVVSSAF